MAETITLTVDQLIELLETLKKAEIPPPESVPLDQRVRHEMTKYSADEQHGEIYLEAGYSEDKGGMVKAGISFAFSTGG